MSRLLSFAGALVDRIKVNQVRREIVEGRPMWVKRRRPPAGPILACANGFFRVVGNPVQAIRDPAEWQRWEAACYRLLHGDEFRFVTLGPDGIAVAEMEGTDLSRHLTARTLNAPMLAAAGRELRRAHELECSELGARWSHGDPHAGNFIYEAASDRARLIDFEVRHDAGLSAEDRHADDLLVLLQDVVGRIDAGQWIPAARAFLEGYGRAEIVDRLRSRLFPPTGLSRVWWAVRTTYLAPGELARRIEALREAL